MYAIAASILIFCLTLPATGHAQTLTILTWDAYFSSALLTAWEARTGATVKQILFDKEEVRNSMLGNVREGSLDLVLIDQVSASLFGERGLLLPVSHYTGVANLQNLDSRWVQTCGDYASPYFWGSMGLVYRSDKVTTPPASWQALLDPEPSLAGHIGMLDSYIDTLAPSLLVRGESINTGDEALLSTVYDELRALIPGVLTFEYALSFVGTDPRGDDLYMALGYSGDHLELNRLANTDTWKYIVPGEGTALWIDCMAVLEGSANKALALDFLNFLNAPDVAAENSLTLGIASPNQAAIALQPEAFRNDPLVYPDEESFGQFQEYDKDITLSNMMVRNRITSALVNLHEAQ
jgi:spermidine/putrescine transport system substrate-binding protein